MKEKKDEGLDIVKGIFDAKGNAIITREIRAMLSMISENIKHRYSAYFGELAKVFAGSDEMMSRIKGVRNTANATIRTISAILSRKSSEIHISDYEKIVKNRELLVNETAYLTQEAGRNKELKEAVKDIYDRTKWDIKDIDSYGKILEKNMQLSGVEEPTKKRSKLGFLKEYFPEQMGGMIRLGSSLMDTVLGPYSGFLKFGYHTISDVYKGIRQWRIDRKAKKGALIAGKRVGGLAQDEFEGRLTFNPLYNNPWYEPRAMGRPPKETPYARIARNERERAWELSMSDVGAMPSKKIARVGEGYLKNSAMPIWYFFDKMWDKAYWTREMLYAVRGRKEQPKLSNNLLFTTGLTAITGLLSAIAGSLAAILSFFAAKNMGVQWTPNMGGAGGPADFTASWTTGLGLRASETLGKNLGKGRGFGTLDDYAPTGSIQRGVIDWLRYGSNKPKEPKSISEEVLTNMQHATSEASVAAVMSKSQANLIQKDRNEIEKPIPEIQRQVPENTLSPELLKLTDEMRDLIKTLSESGKTSTNFIGDRHDVADPLIHKHACGRLSCEEE